MYQTLKFVNEAGIITSHFKNNLHDLNDQIITCVQIELLQFPPAMSTCIPKTIQNDAHNWGEFHVYIYMTRAERSKG